MYKILHGRIERFCEHYHGPKFHAVLCDPPYALLSTGARNGSLRVKGTGPYGRHILDTKGFMGKRWDNQIAFQPDVWAAIADLLYPGGFIMAFGGSRTYHRLACALEDAGLIVHPCIGWVNGQGFPKATRIDTQVDKAAGIEITHGKSFNMKGGCNADGRAAEFAEHGRTRVNHLPATDLARAWAGHRYGLQALKPALELVCVAQKPYEGKPVDCITETGAGSLWVDGGRVGHLTGRRPSAIMMAGGEAWEQEEPLCASCAEAVARNPKHITQGIRASFAQNDAAQITSERAARLQGGTSKMDTGCCNGQSQVGQDGGKDASTNLNTAGSGKITTAPSQQDTLFTTSTATSSTTESRTCSLCGAKIIPQCTSGGVAPKSLSGDIEASLKSSDDTQNMSASAAQGKRWPPNFCLCHLPECVQVGVRKVGSGERRDNVARHRKGFMLPEDANGAANSPDSYGVETIPAYNCVEGCPVAEMDASKGGRSITGNRSESSRNAKVANTAFLPDNHRSTEYPHDTGGPSRFFPNFDYVLERIDAPFMYQAKAGRKEREAGCDALLPKIQNSDGNIRTYNDRCAVCGKKFIGDKGHRCECLPGQKITDKSVYRNRNNHPCIKPLALCQWLATLLLPPPEYAPRRVLVPFSGSGSEMIGALLAGWECVVGVEQSAEYCRIARPRLAHWGNAASQPRLPGT